MDRAESARHWAITTALSYLGTPYIWGGDDPSGFDCSGFVIECLQSAGVLEAGCDLTADQLMRQVPGGETSQPETGALLFFLDSSGKANHVALCLDQWFAISAGGGDRRTLDSSSAWKQNAYVRIRPVKLVPARTRLFMPGYGRVTASNTPA